MEGCGGIATTPPEAGVRLLDVLRVVDVVAHCEGVCGCLLLPPYLHSYVCVATCYFVRMRRANSTAQGLRTFFGAWTVYRRKDDASMWEQFELRCIRLDQTPSEVLARLVRADLIKNP